MAQVKIYGLREQLDPRIPAVSEVLHSCVVDALQYPSDKRAHRFFPLDAAEFFYPAGRSSQYTIIEISMFEGRSVEAKKKLIRLIFERFRDKLDIAPQDVEITIVETPRHNWGFRGLPGDEHDLNYQVEV